MKTDISDIVFTADKKKVISVSSDMDSILYAGVSYPIYGMKPFQLCLTNDNNKQIIIKGDTTLEIVMPCDRCLADVTVSIPIRLHHVLKIEDGRIIGEEDGELTFLEEMTLDVDRLIYDEILVNWPSKILCREDCKGLCPVCGQNLNRQDCGCDRQVVDPRMAKFQDIFNEFKEV